MPEEMFRQLTKNVEKRGVLESLPYCTLTERGVEVVSGHHRIRALRAAKYSKPVWILLETQRLSRDEIRAKQLAHNTIQGFDNPDILREIYLAIADADKRIEAFRAAVNAVMKHEGIRSIGAAVARMAEITLIKLKEEKPK
jgi:hypothetical protein